MSLIFNSDDPNVPQWARQLEQRTINAETNLHNLQQQNAQLQADLAQAQQAVVREEDDEGGEWWAPGPGVGADGEQRRRRSRRGRWRRRGTAGTTNG